MSSFKPSSSPTSGADRLLQAGEVAAVAGSRPKVGALVPVPTELLQRQQFDLPVFLTTELWDAFVIPPETAPEQSRGARLALLLNVARTVLADVPAGRDFAAFSFQVKNRPLRWDVVQAWMAVHVEQPEGLPALILGFERLDEAASG